MEMIADTGMLVGLDIVGTSPVLDERNRTAELAVQLAKSVFAHRIIRGPQLRPRAIVHEGDRCSEERYLCWSAA